MLLIDERTGRKIASDRGIAVRGTLGVLVQARQLGALPALRPVLDASSARDFGLLLHSFEKLCSRRRTCGAGNTGLD